MDIADCSILLRRRYKKCIPFLSISRMSRRRQLHDDYITKDDVAFLSSVDFPGKLCLGLACLAWRVTEESPLLVFAPFEEPREEIFAEIPLGSFIDERSAMHKSSTGRRKKGMRMISLNEHSFLCSSVKDGLPPRRGLFITFRTSETGKLFRSAFNSALRGELQNSIVHTPHMAKHISPQYEDEVRSNGAVRYRKDRCDTSFNFPPASTDALSSPRASQVSEKGNYINGLLAERDRRREVYLSSARAPSEKTGGSFHEWAQSQRLANPSVWNALAGAAEHTSEEMGKRHADGANGQEPNGTSSLDERSMLLCDLRDAMKAFDQMSSTDVSLVGAARDFLRQHQEDLWSAECEERRKQTTQGPSPVPSFSSHKDPGHFSAPGTINRDTGIPLPSEMVKTTPSPAVPPRASEKPISPKASPPPVQRAPQPPEHQEIKNRIQEETERAMAIEARLVASVQRAPPKSMLPKQVSGGAPDVSTAQPASQLLPTPNLNVDQGSANAPPAYPEPVIKEKESPPSCGEKWKPVRDANTGKFYYVHKETKKTTWRVEETFISPTDNVQSGSAQGLKSDEATQKVIDSEPKCGPGWRPVVDPGSGRTYYVNGATKAVTWKLKDTLVKALDTADLQKETKPSTEWTERQDPASGKTYYYNKKTKQTTWKRAETDLELS